MSKPNDEDQTSHRKILGPDFRGRVQFVPERFSCEPVDAGPQSQAPLPPKPLYSNTRRSA